MRAGLESPIAIGVDVPTTGFVHLHSSKRPRKRKSQEDVYKRLHYKVRRVKMNGVDKKLDTTYQEDRVHSPMGAQAGSTHEDRVDNEGACSERKRRVSCQPLAFVEIQGKETFEDRGLRLEIPIGQLCKETLESSTSVDIKQVSRHLRSLRTRSDVKHPQEVKWKTRGRSGSSRMRGRRDHKELCSAVNKASSMGTEECKQSSSESKSPRENRRLLNIRGSDNKALSAPRNGSRHWGSSSGTSRRRNAKSVLDGKGGVRERSVQHACSFTGNMEICREKIMKVEGCIKYLEENGLFRNDDEAPPGDFSGPAPCPGSAGDGFLVQACYVCGKPEDATATLICDFCEKAFHIPCCSPRIRSLPHDDQWICRFCRRKEKKRKAESIIFPEAYSEQQRIDQSVPETWKIDSSRIFRGWDLNSSSKYRTHVRVGYKYQADVPVWRGQIEYNLMQGRPGTEVPLTVEQKAAERELALQNLALNVWPKGWLSALRLHGERENWVQCRNIIYEEGDIGPDGQVVTADIICGKWRRAPVSIVADDGWECFCAIKWDPHHADCNVPQELPTVEVERRLRCRIDLHQLSSDIKETV